MVMETVAAAVETAGATLAKGTEEVVTATTTTLGEGVKAATGTFEDLAAKGRDAGSAALETMKPDGGRLTVAAKNITDSLTDHPVALASSIPAGYDPTGLRAPLAHDVSPYRQLSRAEAMEATARLTQDGSDIHDAYRRGSTFPIADSFVRTEVESQAGGNPNHARDLTYLASVARNAQGNSQPDFVELARNNSVKLDKGDAKFLASNYRQIGESADYRTHLPGVAASYESNIRSIETRSALNGGTMTPADLDHQVRAGVLMSPSGYADGLQPLKNLYPRSPDEIPAAGAMLSEYGIAHTRTPEGIVITDPRVSAEAKKMWKTSGKVE